MSTLDEEMFEEMMKMQASFSREQKQYLLSLVDECVNLGADKKTLAPLYALIFVPSPQPSLTDEEIELGQKMIKALGLDRE